MSEASTPVVTSANFLPEGLTPMPQEDEAFPAPNLYDTTLLLNMEPGLDAWWATVSRILTEYYGAERASLAVPADAGELENVPWGQKATFNASGPPNISSLITKTDHPKKKEAKCTPQSLTPLRNVFEEEGKFSSSASSTDKGARPKMMSRHSYAGYEREKGDVAATPTPIGAPDRPSGPMRTKSYAPQAISRFDDKMESLEPIVSGTPGHSSVQRGSFSDVDFSSLGDDKPQAPFIQVLPVLRALNYESHALLDTTGVNRIIERGKLVTLTRDYSGDHATRRDSTSTSTSRADASTPADSSTRTLPTPTAKPAPTYEPAKVRQSPFEGSRDPPRDKSRRAHDYILQEKPSFSYEEYEQFPSSPWAQSPAPSPAMQANPDENPFFSSGTVDEESFNPQGNTPDYAQFGQVEAIGIDKASTVIHIPLMHPLLSQDLPPRFSRHNSKSHST
jgi:hypothetical protein